MSQQTVVAPAPIESDGESGSGSSSESEFSDSEQPFADAASKVLSATAVRAIDSSLSAFGF